MVVAGFVWTGEASFIALISVAGTAYAIAARHACVLCTQPYSSASQPMSATRRLAGVILLAIALILPAAAARAESTRITFVLVNDIYLMADTMMPDGQRRGGFPRLAAVVKAERAKGGHVILAHGGDTISPVADVGHRSRRPHHQADQHGPPRRVRAGQPRIRLRQGDVPAAHGRGDVSALWRQPARPGRPAAARLQGSLDRDFGRRAHRHHRRGLRPDRRSHRARRI